MKSLMNGNIVIYNIILSSRVYTKERENTFIYRYVLRIIFMCM